MRPINQLAICALGIYLHSSYTSAQNLPPTDLSLDSPNISENSDVGTSLAKLEIEDPDFARIQKISCGSHTLFLMDNGALWGMGSNNHGQLGDGSNQNSSTPYRIFESGVIDVAAGLNHSLVVKSDGSLWTFGANEYGQLGDGTSENINEPKKILEEGITNVWAGGYHSLILMEDNSLWGFGGNGKGQLGNGTTQDINTPIHISDNVTTVGAMGWHTIFINSSGELWGMGSNDNGQLGDGTTEDRNTPVKIIDNGVERIACGGSHTLLTQNGGELWGMGSNANGQLGDGTYENRLTPIMIVDDDVTFIEARANNSIFVKKNGSLWAMGVNNKGQIGDGTNQKRNQPTLVVSENVEQAEAGVSHSLYLMEDGSMWGMGGNSSGELGDGTTTDRLTPIQLYTLTPTFKLVSGDGDEDNDSFHIHGDQLRSEASFDYEENNRYSIRVKGTDIGGLSIEKKFTINVSDGPDAPTGILLSNSTVDENLKKGEVVGNLAAVDEDSGEKHTFKLVDLDEAPGTDTSITIANDNDLFSISGSTLKTKGTFDYESQSAYTILVEVEDKDDLTYTQELGIVINDANDAPTGAELSPKFVTENLPKGTEVGFFSVTDPDADDTHTYKLQGGSDKSSFKLTDGKLLTNAVLDFETKPVLEIVVRASDAKKAYIDVPFTIEVTNSNDAPLEINLDNNTAPENSPPGTKIGGFISDDPDYPAEGYPLAEDLVFWLPLNNGQIIDLSPADNAITLHGNPSPTLDRFGNADSALSFNGSTDWIEANSVADDLAKGSSFSFWMKTSAPRKQALFAINRSASHQGEENNLIAFMAVLANQEQAAIRMRHAVRNITTEVNVANEQWRHVVYSVDASEGDLFVDGSHILDLEDPIYFSADHRVSIGMEYDGQSRVSDYYLGDMDDLRVYNKKLSEEEVARIHALEQLTTSVDYPAFTLVEGKDDDDNALFQITGDELKFAQALDYEQEDEYSIRVRTTDSGGITFEKAFDIILTDAPEAPVGITLDNDSVAENQKKGTEVGTLSAIDPDAGEKHTFKLVEGEGDSTIADNALFAISGTTLKTAVPFDFEDKNMYTVEIEVKDRAKLTYIQALTIQVTDANDAPTAAELSPAVVAENLPKGTEIGTVTVTDPDIGDTHTFKLQGGKDKSLFKIKGNQLSTNATLDYEAKSELEVIVRASDKKKAYIDVPFTISVLDANDPPTDLLIDNLSIVENNDPRGVVGIFTPIDPDGIIDGSEMDVIKSFMTFGGSSFDVITSVASNADGDIFLSGNYTGTIDLGDTPLIGSGSQHQFVVGLNSQHAVEWAHGFLNGHSSTGVDYQRQSITTNSSGDLALAHYFKQEISIDGKTHTSKGASDTLVAQFSAEGSLKWSQSYGGPQEEWGTLVATDSNDNVYTAGNSNRTFFIDNTEIPNIGSSSIFLTKHDSEGELVWSKSIGSPSWDWPGGLATDPEDNIILAGFYRAAIDIDGTTLSHVGNEDILLAKYSSSGNLKWAIGFGAEDQDWPKQVVTDAGGNIYLTGRYSGSITLDGHTLPETSGHDIFLAKFSPQGKALWLRGFEVSGNKDWGHGLAVDAFGNVILTGTIGSTLTIDGNDLHHAGGKDILFARFAPDGSTLHATTIGGSKDDEGLSVAIAANGDYILGGGFRGSIEIAQENPSSQGNMDALLVRIGGASHQVSLVAGRGDDDNAAFAIESGKLVAIDPLNYEVKDEYDVRVRLTDASGTFIEKELSLTVENAPEAPTSITLDNYTVAENQKKGTTVGVLTSEDEDGGEKHTYQLVDAEEGTTNDNALFTISGTTLKTNQSFDYEAASEYSIRVQVTDRDKLTLTQDFIIEVQNLNDAPTDVILTANSVQENSEAGTEVGEFWTLDPDYYLGEKNKLLIDGFPYLLPADFIDIEIYDEGGMLAREPSASGSLVGAVNFEGDADFGALLPEMNTNSFNVLIHGYYTGPEQVVEFEMGTTDDYTMLWVDLDRDGIFKSDGSAGDEMVLASRRRGISTDGGVLLHNGARFAITFRDQGGPGFTSVLFREFGSDDEFTLINPSDPAQDGYWSSGSIYSSGLHTVTLTSGSGDTHNEDFQILDGKLTTAKPLDYEAAATRSIRVEVTDDGGATYQKNFTIEVGNGNDAPTDILLSNDSAAENQGVGTLVGMLTLLDDGNDAPSFALSQGEGDTDNTSFTIDADGLKLSAPMDFETKEEYSIRVTGTDAGGLSIEKVLAIRATDLPEAPIGITLDNDSVGEGLKKGTTVGNLGAIDQDGGEKHVFALVDAAEGETNDNALFKLSGNRLTTNAELDYETSEHHTITVQVTDKDGLTFVQDLLIHVSNGNDAPTGATLSNNEVAENLPAETEIGTLTASDPDRSDVHTFKITGGADKALFQIQGDKLLTSASLDYEAKAELEVTVQVTDDSGFSVEVTLLVGVADENEAPTKIYLQNNEIYENQILGDSISSFSFNDVDGDIERFNVNSSPYSEEENGEVLWTSSFPAERWYANYPIDEAGEYLYFVTDRSNYGKIQRINLINGETSTVGDLSIPQHLLFDDMALDKGGNLIIAYGGEGRHSHGKPITVRVYSYSIQSKKINWIKVFQEESYGELALDIDGNVVLSTSDNLRLLKGENGNLIWERAGSSRAPILSQRGRIYACDKNSKQLTCFNKKDGATLWTKDAQTVYHVIDKSEVLYSFSYAKGIIAIDGITGETLWENNEWNEPGLQPGGLRVIDENGTLIIGQGGGTIAINTSDGSSAWTFTPTEDLQASPSVCSVGEGNRLYLTGVEKVYGWSNYKSYVYCLDSITGALIWKEAYNDGRTEHFSGGRLTKNGVKLAFTYSGTQGRHNELIALKSSSVLADSAPWPVANQNLQNTRSPGNVPIFRLVSGQGDEDNEKFEIDWTGLIPKGNLDYEEQSFFNIRVQLEMPSGLTREEHIQFEIKDVNEVPTGITLDKDTVEENAKAGTVVGRLTGTDPEGDKLTFALAEDDETVDNEKFSLKSPTLSTAEVLDADTNPTLTVRLVATDPSGLSFEQDVTISVTNINEAPTDITLSPNTVGENLPAGTEVGVLTTVDPDSEDIFSYKLISGTGDYDNSSFAIDSASGTVTTSETFDFESRSQYSIRVESKDAGGNKFTKAISITVADRQDAPTAITTDPESGTIREGLPAGTLVTTLSTVDPDSGDTFEYSLVSGAGDTNNSLFRIAGNQLQTNAVLTQVQTPTASVRIRSTDGGGNTVEREVAVTVLDQNDTPNNISLSSNSVQENQPFGTAVGSLTATDPDVGDSHTFELVSGSGDAGNASFFIQNGNELVTNDFLDYETKNSYSIRVQVSDASGATFTKALTINVSDEEPEPVRYRLTVNRIPEEGGLTPGAGLYDEDESVDVTVTTDPNYTFAGWTGDLPAGSNSGDLTLSMTMDSDKTINAYFARTYHEVEVLVTPDRHGYVRGGGSVLHGTEITLNAEELSDPDTVPFSHWVVNGIDQEVDEANPMKLVLTVEDSLRVEAVFNYGLPESMKHVASGSFTMGDDDSRAKEQKPAHAVDVSGYYIDSLETSKSLWYEVYTWALQNGYNFSFSPTEANGRNRPHNDGSYKDDFPITGISWYDMVKWTNARSEKEGLEPVYFTDTGKKEVYRTDPKQNGGGTEFTGFLITDAHVDWRAKGYRLPTEAEWEKAARGGVSGLLYPHGDSIDSASAHYDSDSNLRDITTVGSYPANAYGLYDMSGNAWEACWDWMWKNWYSQPEASLADPKGPNYNQIGSDNWAVRVARGGSGNSDHYQTQVAYRKDFNKTWFQYAITVRPVVSAPTEPDATITLKVEPANLGSATGAGVYKIGTQASLSAILESNAEINRWEDAEGNTLSKAADFGFDATEDMVITLYLNDTSTSGQNFYTVETEVQPFGSGTIQGGGAYLAGSVVTLTAEPPEGMDFAGWSGDVSGTSATTTLSVNGNKQVVAYFGDTSLDNDDDGLSDLYEQSLGSDPFNADSDGDGLKDGDEANIHGSSPVLADTDADGFDDRAEVNASTDPKNADDFPFLVTKDLARYFMFKGSAMDNSPNKIHGKVNSASEDRDRYGFGKNAYHFNGSKSYVEATNYKGAAGGAARTVSGWIRVGLESDKLPGVFNSMESLYNSEINNMEADYASVLNDLESSYGLSLNSMDSAYTSILNDLQSSLSSRLNQLEKSSNETLILKVELGQFLDNQESDLATALDAEKVDFEAITENASARNAYASLAEQQIEDFSALADSIQSQWVTDDATENTGTLVSWGKSGNTFEINLNEGVLQVVADGNTLEGSTSLVDDDWHQFAVVVNEDGSLDDAAIYLDGVAEAVTKTGATNSAVATVLDKNARIGNGPSGFFEGWIDDIRLYERSLTASEITKLYDFEVSDEPLQPETLKPEISEHPSHASVALGETATFRVTALAFPAPTYTWQKQANRKWTTIQGATSNTLTVSDAEADDASTYRVIVANSEGYRNSKGAKLAVLTKPTFTEQPKDQSFLVGKTGNIYAFVSGSKKLSFEWFKDGEAIATTTSNKVSLRKMKASEHDGMYSVKVSNAVGQVTSQDFQVSIIEPVKIDASPEDAGIVIGNSGSLTVSASGGGTLSYQWVKYDAKSRKWNNVAGATSATLNIAAIKAEDEGKYKCLVNNGPSTYYSKDADLMMYVPPTIKTQPRSVSQKEAGKVSLKGEALGTPLPTYQWRKLAGDGTTWEDVPKANKSTLYFSKIKKEQAGKYRLRATNAGGHIDSDAVDIVVYYAPVLTTNIASKTSLNEEENTTLIVAADVLDSKGTDATYTWFKDKKALKDGGTVSGSKTAALTISGATGTDSGSYWCEIKNGVGTTKSASSKLTVLLKPYTSKSMKSLDIAEGKNATFSASIKGGKPMTLQWYHNDAEISGQTKNKLSLRGVTTSQAGTYKLVATNPAGTLEMEATLAVTAASTYVAPVANDLAQDSPGRILSQALGANPTTGQTYQPIIDTVEDGEGTTYVSFSYTENKDAEGMQYILEGSSDLNTWTPVDLSQASVNRLDRGKFTEVTVYIPARSSQGFFRVRVE